MSEPGSATLAHLSRWMTLADLRWKCGTCDEWHTGPCLDFGVDSPYYWSDDHEKVSKTFSLLPSWRKKHNKTFLDEDYCADR